MEDRAAKLALARKKLKDHQEKKSFGIQKDDIDNSVTNENSVQSVPRNDEEFVINPDNTNSEVSEVIEIGVTNTTKFNQNDVTPVPSSQTDINVTEILISNKRNLELQVHDLQSKLSQLELNHALVINEYKACNKKIVELENELKNINNKYITVTQEISIKDAKITELNSVKSLLTEENSNLIEQLEFTKTVVSAKEAETDSLHSQLFNLQNQYDVILLQLQQLTNGTPDCQPNRKASNTENTEAMLQKISNLEQQLNSLQKERDQMNLHYEHYVAELNEQLKAVMKKNEDLTREVDNLSNRENSLIEQISDMEIRIQNYKLDKYKIQDQSHDTDVLKDLQDELNNTQEKLNKLKSEYEELQTRYSESIAKVKELSEVKEAECNHENISLSKLNADMASDKIAAQRATEQNKKLKQDLQGLEDDFVKMSKDKLELTEKIAAEKYLNRELTIKLAEVEEKAKEMQVKLKAKDDEMIRLQSSYREMEKQCELLINLSKSDSPTVLEAVDNSLAKEETVIEEEAEHLLHSNHKSLSEQIDDKNSLRLQKEEAMLKLQDRFLKIMGEVADLSDEKHRLEHIILQLQNETETICEYVALYQQQRSLLKRRDEERSAQLKVFQQECGKLQSELEELTGILARFADDKELSSYFLTESKRLDMERVMTLLSNLKNNSLIDPKKKNIDFKNFYPCNCCSGKLIEV